MPRLSSASLSAFAQARAQTIWMLGGRPLPYIEDHGTEIDFSASCVIDDPERGGSEPGAWALALMFSPLHLTGTNTEAQDDHAA